MEKEVAVTNTNTLIFLAKLNLFELAKNMFKEIRVPEQVIEELFGKESPENPLIEKELESFLRKVKVKKIKELPLEEGESSAVSYCIENNLQVFLSDDKKARIVAESLGLKVKGMLGILLWNLEYENIEKKECERLIESLIELGYYIDSELFAEVVDTIRDFKSS